MGRERDHKDAAHEIARDLAEIASHIAQLKGDAHAYLSDPNYNTLKLREWRQRTLLKRLLLLRPGGG